MITLLFNLWPELALCATACVLLLLGALQGKLGARIAPLLTGLVLLGAMVWLGSQFGGPSGDLGFTDSLSASTLGQYIRILACGAGVLFVLLAWPTKVAPGGNGSLAVGGETSEYYALMLLSLAGLMVAAGSNNLILLFLGLELASIPTYIMVSISRPLPIAQEAGVKYFFLGALSAALMLLGFSYLYGTTGSIYLDGGIEQHFYGARLRGFASMEELAIVLLIAGFGFKMAAVPLHVYVADVYQGAASPVTALLGFVPKAAGLAALVKLLSAVGGPDMFLPHRIVFLVAVLAALTMSVGNVLALLQFNVKRVMAYSSVAHSGYMLAGVAAMLAAGENETLRIAALGATLFYLAVYTLMNTGFFAVLQQLPARRRFGEESSPTELAVRGAGSAETYEDIAGYGRRYPLLGFGMLICCLSLVGIPATAGFLGKLMLVKPLLDANLTWLVVVMMLNAAVSAAYYLKVPASMFMRAASDEAGAYLSLRSGPASAAVLICALGIVAAGVVLPLSNELSRITSIAAGAAPAAVRHEGSGAPVRATPRGGARTGARSAETAPR